MPSIAQTIRLVAKLYQDDVALMHILDVYARVNNQDEETQQLALLHDIVEDGFFNVGGLGALGYSEALIKSIELLTRYDDGKTYMDYIKRIKASRDPRALTVKLADLQSNLARLDGLPPDKARSLGMRYRNAFRVLKQGAPSS